MLTREELEDQAEKVLDARYCFRDVDKILDSKGYGKRARARIIARADEIARNAVIRADLLHTSPEPQA